MFSPPVARSNSSSVRLAVERSAPVRVAPSRIALERSASKRSALERSAWTRFASERFAPMRFGSIERFSPLHEFQGVLATPMATSTTQKRGGRLPGFTCGLPHRWGCSTFYSLPRCPRADLQEYGIAESRDFLFLPHSPECNERGFLRRWTLYPCESADCSSSTIFKPSIISNVKRTMPLSLPLCSK